MTVADLHPEDLLDREANGTLTDAERPILEAHLAHCSACRFELRARKDFAVELGPELPVHDGALLVTTAIERATSHPPPAPVPAPEPTVLPARRRSARRAATIVLIAATFLLATASFAAVQSSAFTTMLRAAGFAPSVLSQGSSAAEPSPGKPLPSGAQAAEPAPPAPAEVPSEPPEVVPAPAEVASAPPIARAVRPAPAPVAASTPLVVPDPPRAPTPAASTAVSEASALFAEAGAARRRGDHTAASRLYRALLAEHGTAPEAISARVAFARLLLDDGDPAAALPLFEQYVASDERVLREEALVGRARALGRLGRLSDERGAWSSFLESYPRSLHADRARERLVELGDR